LGISSHHRRTTIASLSWPLLLIHAWQSCIPCRVSFYFSGFLRRKGNYRDSFGRHSSLPFIIIFFPERTHCLRFFISFLFSWLAKLLASMVALEKCGCAWLFKNSWTACFVFCADHISHYSFYVRLPLVVWLSNAALGDLHLWSGRIVMGDYGI